MIVSGFIPIDRKRTKVFLDGEFAFVLYKGELRLYKVCEGEELTKEHYDEIIGELLPKRAKSRAMNLLKERDYTEYRLREKLRLGFYPENVIDETIDYLKNLHYLDDGRYARDYITLYLQTKSKRRIIQDLEIRGISKNVISKVFSELEDDGIEPEEELQIRELLRKRHYNPETATPSEKQKQIAFLFRKGYSGELIRKIMGNLEEY